MKKYLVTLKMEKFCLEEDDIVAIFTAKNINDLKLQVAKSIHNKHIDEQDIYDIRYYRISEEHLNKEKTYYYKNSPNNCFSTLELESILWEKKRSKYIKKEKTTTEEEVEKNDEEVPEFTKLLIKLGL